MSTAAGAATDTETGVKQALAAADASPRVPAASTVDQLAPVADAVRRTTERVGRPPHAVPPAVPALLPPAAGQAVPPVTRGPARPVIPLRPGITRPPLPPAAIAVPVADNPARPGSAGAIVTSQSETVTAIQADPRVPAVPPAGSGARRAGTVLPALPAPDAVRGGVSLVAVLCLSGALAAWLLWRLLPAPAVRRAAAISWLVERPGQPRG